MISPGLKGRIKMKSKCMNRGVQSNGWCRHISWLVLIVSLSIGSLGVTSASAADSKQEFPRLGGVQIGGTPYEDGLDNREYQREISRLDLAVLGETSKSVIEIAEAIKALNPGIKLGNYNNVTEVQSKRQGYFTKPIEKLSSEKGPNNSNAPDWWLYDKDGNIVAHTEHPNRWRANITEYVKPDANGDRYPEWKAKYDYGWIMGAQVWDFWYQDVVNYRPKFQSRGFIGDFSGGQISNVDELSAAWRRGHKKGWDEIRKLTPDKMIVGNINWYLYQESTGRWDLTEFDQQLEGGLLEHIMNWDRSVEANKGWETLRLFYYWMFDYLRQPKLVIFNVYGDPKDYRFVRYSFASCLMNDGYYDFSPLGAFNFGTVQWFDEFDLAGRSDTSWLGKAISSPPDQPWRNGVYRRDFQNGIALVNPRGNGAVTITVEPGFTRINGNQDRAVNNGQPAGNINFADGDGIVLVRDSGVLPAPDAPPKPPTLEVS